MVYGAPVPYNGLDAHDQPVQVSALSADMKDDRFLNGLSDHTYQLVVTPKASPVQRCFPYEVQSKDLFPVIWAVASISILAFYEII